MFKKIVVGYDGSKSARAALERAATLGQESGAELTALWVQEPLPRHSDLPGEYEEEAEAAAGYFKDREKEVGEIAAKYGVTIRRETRRGHPAKAILKYADEIGH